MRTKDTLELAFKLLVRKRSLTKTISQKKKKKIRWFFLAKKIHLKLKTQVFKQLPEKLISHKEKT